MSRRFLIISGLLSCFTLFVQWGLSGFTGLIFGVLEIAMCSFIATILISLFPKGGSDFSFHFLRSTLVFTAVLGVFSMFILAFIAYQNIFPAAVGKIILSNNEKTIVVYQMSHIATPQFYEQVHTDLVELAASGYLLYTEGVGSGTRENQDRFDRLLGVKMTTSLYATLAGAIGLTSQNADLYKGIPSGSIQNVDISIDTIVSLIGTGVNLPIDSPMDIEDDLRNISQNQNAVLFNPLIRAFLNFILKNGGDIDIGTTLTGDRLSHAIIHDRNAHIVDTLKKSDQKNFVLIYGALHFEGMYSLLQAHDKNWRIISIEPLYPYAY